MEMILTIFVIVIFVIFLCFFLILCQKCLGQTGETEIFINNDKKVLKTEKGQKLLAALADSGIHLPAACGGKGNCGKCKIKVLAGGGPVNALEKTCLNSEDLNNGFRLACQVKIREQLRLDIPEELFLAQRFQAKLIDITKVAEKIKTLRFKINDGVKISFKAGQYLQIIKFGPRENIIRAYSISSSPNQNDEFSLDIQLVDGGIMSNYLHDSKIGDVFDFTGPYGDMAISGLENFTINSNENQFKNIVLVAGGVGLAPMRSIIAFLNETKYLGKVYLFHGAKNRSNLYCEEEYRYLQKINENFIYIPVLSEPALEDGWIGETGFITEILSKSFSENSFDIANTEFYLCGPAVMMKVATELLLKKNFSESIIHSDPFSF